MFKKVLILVLPLLAVATLAAPIYKWVDEKGVTHYSEKPPPKQKVQEIQVQPAPPAAGAESGKSAAKSWQEQELERKNGAGFTFPTNVDLTRMALT